MPARPQSALAGVPDPANTDVPATIAIDEPAANDAPATRAVDPHERSDQRHTRPVGSRGTSSAAAAQDEDEIRVGDLIDGKYRLRERLGAGGMAVVYRAEHLGLKRDVAVKVLLPQWRSHKQFAARFDREARCVARLDHPNCLRVLDYGRTEVGIPYMVAELVTGAPLVQRLGKPFSPLRAAGLVVQILSGLEHAHEQGVIHRDLKPDNVLLTRDHEGRDLVKLLDFGIAKLDSKWQRDGHEHAEISVVADPQALHQSAARSGQPEATVVTRVGVVFGTPQYMSPEQAGGLPIDARSDLYSTGLVLYEMLSGRQAFRGKDPVALVTARATAKPPPLPKRVPPVLRAYVFKLLERLPDNRFANATAARTRLEAIIEELRNDRFTGRPPPPPSRPRTAPPRGDVAVSEISKAYNQVLDEVIAEPEDTQARRLSDAPAPRPSRPELSPPTLRPLKLEAIRERSTEFDDDPVPSSRGPYLLGFLLVVAGAAAAWWSLAPLP